MVLVAVRRAAEAAQCVHFSRARAAAVCAIASELLRKCTSLDKSATDSAPRAAYYPDTNRIPTCGAAIMRSIWAKAVLLLASCGALVACDGQGGQAVSNRPQSAFPATGHVQGAVDADPGKYDVVKMAQPADRVVEF
jgi:hypothetical protein